MRKHLIIAGIILCRVNSARHRSHQVRGIGQIRNVLKQLRFNRHNELVCNL